MADTTTELHLHVADDFVVSAETDEITVDTPDFRLHLHGEPEDLETLARLLANAAGAES